MKAVTLSPKSPEATVVDESCGGGRGLVVGGAVLTLSRRSTMEEEVLKVECMECPSEWPSEGESNWTSVSTASMRGELRRDSPSVWSVGQ